MAIQQSITTSFKVEMLTATHNFTASTGDIFKIALYTSNANLGPATTAYTTANEVPSTGGYTAGGNTLSNITPTSSGTTALTDFADSTWVLSTITARGALIYNSSKSNKSVLVLDFGSDKSSIGGDFIVIMPPATATEAIIRIV